MITEFKLSKAEISAAEKFWEDHRHLDVPKGVSGGHISYKFTPCSIGTGVTIHCNICREFKDITDYDNW